MNGIWLVSYITLWVLFLVVAITLLTVLRNLGAIYEIISKTPPGFQLAPTKLKQGDALPDVQGIALQGQGLALSRMLSGETAVIVLSPSCGPCRSLMGDVLTGRRQLDPQNSKITNWLIVSIGEGAETQNFLQDLQLPSNHSDQVMIVPRETITDVWGITSTPTTVIVDDNRRVVRQVFGA